MHNRIALITHKYYFWIFLVIAFSIYVLQQLEIRLPLFFQNYLNDLLCMPLVLSVCQLAVRKLKNDTRILLPMPLLILVTIGYSIYFEWYLPQYDDRYTADWLDVLMYFIGMFFFYAVEKHKRI
ncbi:hypothetical protein [uncultured Aquimarina sp.]|uniref:hypothetical protein n=1 Tax=uncultured Aquimarina sp. TaxID=575652 RepID=UPI002603EA04|nr:hypothetical protein [uncultured Aquimarina sp.]